MNRKLKLLIAVLAASIGIVGVAAAASSPAVTTGKATSIKSSSAVLNGTVNPNGNTAHYEFQLGLTKAYGVTLAAKNGVRGSKPVAVKRTAGQLLPGTVYHYRLVATNGSGTSVGTDRTFRTGGNPPPEAATGPATNVGTNTATVTGVINPKNQQTTYIFQYGASAYYGMQTSPQNVPAGNSPVNVSRQLSLLPSATTVHYRIVAFHGGVAAYGADATFFTEPSPAPSPRVHASTTPHHAKFAPYVFTTFGRVVGPSSIPQAYACSGNVAVRFLHRHHQVSRIVVALQPNCTYSGQTVFNQRPGHRRLRVAVRFLGNGYLASAYAPHRQRVIVG